MKAKKGLPSKIFCTAGPVRVSDHYCLPPIARINLEEILLLIEQKKYFVLHAPRQTGKTSSLFALQAHLNKGAEYRALYVNFEKGQFARDNAELAMKALVDEIALRARTTLKDGFPEKIAEAALAKGGGGGAINHLLSMFCEHSSKPLVLMIDEIDSLVGDTLISVLRQIRSGYDKRPDAFPQSVILCGVRDIRDYRIQTSGKDIITGGSAFNIKAESLRMGNFTREDVFTLLEQHTSETGQVFEESAQEGIWEQTQGQPWLVNALAYECCFRMVEGKNREQPITAEMIEQAKENLILRRDTHLDQLTDKLREDRVRRVIEPVLSGNGQKPECAPDDIQYLIDLGLIQRSRQGEITISNPIYREIIPRELTWTIQAGIHQQTSWYVESDGKLDMAKLLTAFQEFFRENSESWIERFEYREAGPQLLLQAFLQRIVNGGGTLIREYALGRMRTDLLITWPYPGGKQRVVIEIKILYKTMKKTISDGLSQIAEYIDRCGGATEAHLIVCDRSPRKPWKQKIFRRKTRAGSHTVTIWGM